MCGAVEAEEDLSTANKTTSGWCACARFLCQQVVTHPLSHDKECYSSIITYIFDHHQGLNASIAEEKDSNHQQTDGPPLHRFNQTKHHNPRLHSAFLVVHDCRSLQLNSRTQVLLLQSSKKVGL